MNNSSFQTRTRAAAVLAGLAAWLAVLSFADRAQAIPVFARKYHTSCITCHTVYPKLNVVGEAFRRNGYQFPSDEDVLVKEEPVKLGIDAYKDMFPNSIWPSTLPSIPPVSVFVTMQSNVSMNKRSLQSSPGPYSQWDLAFPSDIELIGEGAIGKDISGFWNVGFDPAGGAGVGRVFVQFSNLFAWDPDEDDNGCHLGSRWAVLPPHALNLRVGKIDPQVLPHVITEESFPLLMFPSMPTNSFSLAQTAFSYFAEQPGIEASGIIDQYWSYAVGFVNGGSAVFLPDDDNTYKDVYFRVARKWFGYPLDGVVGQGSSGGGGGGQGDEDEFAPRGLDFWREVGLETGVSGWWGKSSIPNVNVPGAFVNDYFHRFSVDARWWFFDLDIYGVAFYGNDPFPGFLPVGPPAPPDGSTDQFGFFIQADYMIKPWLMAFVRYEQIKVYNTALADEEQGRIVPGITMDIRQNLRLSTEIYIDTRNAAGLGTVDTGNNPEFNDMWVTSLQFAF